MHRLMGELLAVVPPDGAPWPRPARQRWVAAMSAVLEVLYEDALSGPPATSADTRRTDSSPFVDGPRVLPVQDDQLPPSGGCRPITPRQSSTCGHRSPEPAGMLAPAPQTAEPPTCPARRRESRSRLPDTSQTRSARCAHHQLAATLTGRGMSRRELCLGEDQPPLDVSATQRLRLRRGEHPRRHRVARADREGGACHNSQAPAGNVNGRSRASGSGDNGIHDWPPS